MVELAGRLARPNAEIAFADTASDGPPLVFTHGAGLDHTMFDDLLPALTARGYRVIVWDLRGHGQSPLTPGARFTAADALDDLAALLDACQTARPLLTRPVLIGHSLGGNLVQAFVRRHPLAAAGQIVMDATCNTGPLLLLERSALRLAAPILALIPMRSLSGQMARASAITPVAIVRAAAIFGRMPRAAFLDVWRATTSLVIPDPGYSSPVPLALMRGARDRTGNIATAMPRWAHAAGIPEHIIPDAGHILTWDAPDATSAALLEILTQWEEGSSGARMNES